MDEPFWGEGAWTYGRMAELKERVSLRVGVSDEIRSALCFLLVGGAWHGMAWMGFAAEELIVVYVCVWCTKLYPSRGPPRLHSV
jgi:hypothetical protein